MIGALLLAAVAAWSWPARPGPGPRSPRPGTSPGHASLVRRLGGLRGRARRQDDDGWVADLAEVVVVGLEAGLDLSAAVLTAARSPSVARRSPRLVSGLAAVVASGGSVTHHLAGLVDDARSGVGAALLPSEADEIDLVVRAWRLSERTGAAASATTAAAARALRDGRADRERARAVAAGPRASMVLLSTLPLLGPGVGFLVGVTPDRLYGSGAARAGALVGLLLTAGGWLWGRHVLGRASRPATTGGRAR